MLHGCNVPTHQRGHKAEDGYNLRWGTNVVGPFLSTELLMPALLESIKTSSGHHVRVIVASYSGAYADVLHWDAFKFDPQALYFQSMCVSSPPVSRRVVLVHIANV